MPTVLVLVAFAVVFITGLITGVVLVGLGEDEKIGRNR